ncbi:MAG: exosortase A [Sedimenticola sp.]
MIDSTVKSNNWKRQGILLSILLIVLIVAYYETFESIVAIWIRSETFAHGFIIAPITLWLVWRVKDQLYELIPETNYIGLPLLFMAGLIWLLATYIDVLAIQQLAVVSMIPLIVLSAFGWKITIAIAFPLFFLMLSVPIGEELTPVLIEFTADFTVAMIKLVNIPVYREGNFLQLPTGNWSVVKACSGVRYLIASVTLGLLYAYLNYKSLRKKIIFIAASIVIPIIANGLRAFIIVMLGHLSDMKIATGVDHLIYGWIFFGIVIGIMFFVGSFWWDKDYHPEIVRSKHSIGDLGNKAFSRYLAILMAAVLVLVWPFKVYLESQSPSVVDLKELTVSMPDGWDKMNESFIWKPDFHGMDEEFSASYRNHLGQAVNLYIGYYADQRQDAELGNYNNVLVSEKNRKWRVVNSFKNQLDFNRKSLLTKGAILTSGSHQLMTIYLYYVNGELITDKYLTKLLQAKAKLFGERNDGAVVFFTAIYEDKNKNVVDKFIKEFALTSLPHIKSAVDGMRY